MIGMQIRLRQTFECRVCKQYRDEERADQTKITAMLFGIAAYAVCPSCWQEPVNHHDRNYRARFRRFMLRSRRGLFIDAPISSFTTPGGRTFEVRTGTYFPPRFKGDDVAVGIVWPIFYKGEQAGSIAFDLKYDRTAPSFHASANKLRWHFSADAPTGIGFDVSKSDTIEEVTARWSHSADEILDWHEGKRVESIFIHPKGWAQKGVS